MVDVSLMYISQGHYGCRDPVSIGHAKGWGDDSVRGKCLLPPLSTPVKSPECTRHGDLHRGAPLHT